MVPRNEPAPYGQRSRKDLRSGRPCRPGTRCGCKRSGKQSSVASSTTVLVEQRKQQRPCKRPHRSKPTGLAGAKSTSHRHIRLCRTASTRQRTARETEGALRKTGRQPACYSNPGEHRERHRRVRSRSNLSEPSPAQNCASKRESATWRAPFSPRRGPKWKWATG